MYQLLYITSYRRHRILFFYFSFYLLQYVRNCHPFQRFQKARSPTLLSFLTFKGFIYQNSPCIFKLSRKYMCFLCTFQFILPLTPFVHRSKSFYHFVLFIYFPFTFLTLVNIIPKNLVRISLHLTNKRTLYGLRFCATYHKLNLRVCTTYHK